MPAPVASRVHGDQLNRAVMMSSSPIKLGRGGRARLARLEINHHVAESGKIVWSPRAKIIVRLCVRS